MHDGMAMVLMMLMFYQRRASPKHRYSIIEVDYALVQNRAIALVRKAL